MLTDRMGAMAMAVAMAMAMVVCAMVGVAVVQAENSEVGGTIGFATLGRLSYAFDVYTVERVQDRVTETRVTMGESVSYSAQLVQADKGSAFVKSLKQGLEFDEDVLEFLVYVSEVEGSAQLYLDLPLQGSETGDLLSERRRRRVALRGEHTPPKVYLDDRPSMNGDMVVFVSTEEDVGKPLQGWNAVFSLNFKTSVTRRLTPRGVTDYSPALSPSGEWVAVASNEGRGWEREIEGLNLDLYVFKAEDGSHRRMVVKNAGWPTWSDDSTVYFHRIAEDGWWSIFRINVADSNAEKEAERITPPGVHAFTPAASTSGKWIAVATRRTSIRHIEIFDLEEQKFRPLTALINPTTHHYSPFVSPSSNKLGYHRCRGIDQGDQNLEPRVENVKSPLAGVSLIRIRGSFGVISPDGNLIAAVDSSSRGKECLAVMKLDGSGKRVAYEGQLFGIAWDPTGSGTVYVGQGKGFSPVTSAVHIVAIAHADTADVEADERSSSSKFLTKEGTGNNAFPSPSPDGKHIVFRSGRSGYKNLYIMDAADGEVKYLRRLTDGPWIDTMPNWSPDNEWIAFSSNRLHPTGERSFSLYRIRPDGTDLHLLLDTGIGGLAMHPIFSPDGKRIAFASDLAGVSAEPIAWPHAYQPYGEIFVIGVDGSGLTRLTHNAYEDGTPTWGPLRSAKSAVSTEGELSACDFDDVWFLNKPAEPTKPTKPTKPVHRECQRGWDPVLPAVAQVMSSYM